MSVAMRRIRSCCLASVFAVTISACGGGHAAPGCDAASCPTGCCSGDICLDSMDTTCGSGGGQCVDCTAGTLTDACSQGSCVCQAAGGSCQPGQTCTSSGCIGCIPDCAGKQCGPDGCGNTCGVCTYPWSCDESAGICEEEVVDCTGKECGSDGMGGSCGECVAGQVCVVAKCVDDVANSAVFVSQTVPAAMSPGAVVDVSVTFRNSGYLAWKSAAGYKLGAENPRDNSTWGSNRVQLEAGESIANGETKTFEFQVNAPAAAGTYDFQWRMLEEGVEWFGDFSQNVIVTVGSSNITVCEVARPLAGVDSDASAVIQGCIDATPTGEIMEIPVGVYRIDHQLQINARPITVRSEGRDANQPKCALDGHDCAVLRASPVFGDTLGILQVLQDGSLVDHIVLDGNKTARAGTTSGQQCAAYSNSYGYNLRMVCDNCTLSNSVTKNALCGTGCEVTGARDNVTIFRNTVAYNGVHDHEGMWSDGITVHDAANSSFTENEIIDNTDVDLIFGGCKNCVIQNNLLWHTDTFAGGSFAALMLHAWPDGNGGNGTSGDFSGSDTSANSIDCGLQRRCGFGLYLGSDAWYITDVFGGAVHDNDVQNAQQGVLLDDVHDMQVYDNPVANPAVFMTASCGQKWTQAYGIGTRSHDIDISADTLGTSYESVDWDGCIPNWWNQ